MSAEASDAIFTGSVAPNAPLLAAYAEQVSGAALLIDHLTRSEAFRMVINRSVMIRALDAVTPKFYGTTVPICLACIAVESGV